ncbi:MAG TPA: DUF418 domain-containing protein [Polyangiaceae bacterium]|nr:DUF418 domain-containing protein [Polyangiaceae bacterium]
MRSLGPVAPEERLLSLDVLRAVALLGILSVNIVFIAHSMPRVGDPLANFSAWYDRLAGGLVAMLVSGKANSLFTFAFGVGFAVQMRRLEAGGPGAARTYLRRLAALFAFGAAHALLVWDGDILHTYALLGLVLLAVRRVSRRGLAALVVATALVPEALGAYRAATADAQGRAEEREARAARVAQLQAEGAAAYGAGSYADVVRHRTQALAEDYGREPHRRASSYLSLLTTMLLGLFVGRERLLERAAELRRGWRRAAALCALVGLVSGALFAVLVMSGGKSPPPLLDMATGLAYRISRPTLMLAYAAVVVLACLSPRWGPSLARLAPAGRMALTNYLMQSAVCTSLFYAYGAGLYGRVGIVALQGIALALWATQIALSTAWLRRFRQGPAEWLWRTLTYGRPAPAAAAPAVAKSEAA